MYQPIISGSSRQKGDYLNSWRGINRKEYAKENEFSAMSNLSSDKYPYISVRRRRVADNTLVYKKGEIYDEDGKYAGHIKYRGDDCIVNFNKNILHTSGLSYYDYVHGESGKMCGEYVNKKKIIVEGFTSANPAYSLTFDDTSPSLEWNEFLKVGDRIEISGTGNAWIDTIGVGVDVDLLDLSVYDEEVQDFGVEYLPVTCIVEGFEYEEDDDGREYCVRVNVNFYNKNGKLLRESAHLDAKYEKVTVKKAVPPLTDICVYNNRVFGVDEKGGTIYASALGSYSEWFRYEGLSTDSWYSEVGEDGEFTGIAECGGSIIAFKRDYIYKIYGDTAKNFTVQKISSNGCIDKQSIIELNGRLYFLNYNGFCVYSGGYPTVISDVLGKTYTNAIGGTDGRKLYFYATASTGEKELAVYDTMLDMWHIEDSTDEVYGYFRYNGGAYFVDSGGDVYKYNCDDYRDVDWSFTTPENNMLGMNYTKLSDVVIFAATDAPDCQCQIKVEVIYDGENESVDCGSFLLVPGKTQRIPIRLRQCFAYALKVSGTGPVIIKGIEKVFTAGGRNEGNRG